MFLANRILPIFSPVRNLIVEHFLTDEKFTRSCRIAVDHFAPTTNGGGGWPAYDGNGAASVEQEAA
jgi:hypothetical protein